MNKVYIIILYFIFLCSSAENLCQILKLDGEDLSSKYHKNSCGLHNSNMNIIGFQKLKRSGKLGLLSTIPCPEGEENIFYGNRYFCITPLILDNYRIELRGYLGGIYIFQTCPSGSKISAEGRCVIPVQINSLAGYFINGNNQIIIQVKNKNDCPSPSTLNNQEAYNDGTFHCVYPDIDPKLYPLVKVTATEIQFNIDRTCIPGYICYWGDSDPVTKGVMIKDVVMKATNAR